MRVLLVTLLIALSGITLTLSGVLIGMLIGARFEKET